MTQDGEQKNVSEMTSDEILEEMDNLSSLIHDIEKQQALETDPLYDRRGDLTDELDRRHIAATRARRKFIAELELNRNPLEISAAVESGAIDISEGEELLRKIRTNKWRFWRRGL